MPAFQPYWGKPAVRNDRGDGGNVGIIRSPLRATVLPDCRRLGRIPEARASYENALVLARQEPERCFLARRLEELK
jgi:hypothetical protein